jgi:hypothetical protein
MLNNSPINKSRSRPNTAINTKPLPRLSLSLHTMPQTADSHFKKWLILGLLIFILMILVAFLAFWK